MVRLLFGTTSELLKTISERFFNCEFYLFFADHFNAWPQNPPSSNPFQIFLDYAEIVRTNDRYNSKYIAHRNGLRKAIRKHLKPSSQEYKEALLTLNSMGTLGMKPYLAILELDTYNSNRGKSANTNPTPVSSSKAGSPTSIEYLLTDVRGPSHSKGSELHLEKLHF